MTLWDIFDAWTDSALEAPARDNGTHAISIHAPRRGSDFISFVGSSFDFNFNPRSPQGERPLMNC